MLTQTDELERAADIVLDRLGVNNADAFLVLSNSGLAEVTAALATAASAVTDNVRDYEFAASTRDGEEPPPDVAAAMGEATAIAIVTRFSLSHTQARLQATRAGARIASLPGITQEIFTRALAADYAKLQRVGRALAADLSRANVCRVKAPAGTDVELSLRGRQAVCDDGDLCARAAFGNLPAGEAYVAPREEEVEGTVVFDGSLAGWGLLDQALIVEIARGRLVSARGGAAAEWLLQTLDAGGANGRTIAELGIGTNDAATVSGVILEDEKAEGTVHFAFGANTGFGGTNEAAVHIDGLVREPAVELDGRPILHGGRLSISVAAADGTRA
jgi:leucyl aminopeptidase (aminopeptidase T)